jgi:nucleoid-associated protein YgaU
MPNDAKLGMIVGVGLVIAIAVVFFRKGGATGETDPEPAAATATPPAAATAVHPVSPPTDPVYRGMTRTVQARTAIRTGPAVVEGQRHTVSAGETLFSLAQRYYKDERKFVDIYRVNQDKLESPDRLTPGTVLIIPNLP